MRAAAANIAEAACDRHARERPDALAVIEHRAGATARPVTFAELAARSAALAGGLARFGIVRGDRVAVALPQSAESLAWHLAGLRLGAISVPVAPVYTAGALRHRLADSGARILATDAAGAARARDLERPETLEAIVCPGAGGDLDPDDMLGDAIAPVPVAADDPAFIFYTSGSTGAPKGVVTAHRALAAVRPGFERVFELAPRPGDVFWTPSDWSWLGALVEVVLPALAAGRPVVACPERFSVAGMYEILGRHRVTCAFLVPHVLRRICAEPPPAGAKLHLRAVMTGGERLAPGLRSHIGALLGAAVNDDFGLTEATHLAVGCEALRPTPDGAVGPAVPGRRIAVLRPGGGECRPGETGEIAVRADDPIVMLGYWQRPSDTAARLRGGWLHTGDSGRIDEDGMLWFEGRDEDVLKVAGMLVGAEEIETAICGHPDVLECGVATADADGGEERPVAYVALRPGATPSDDLAVALCARVRADVAAHAAPGVIRFVAALPHTATGKVRRRDLAAVERGSRDAG